MDLHSLMGGNEAFSTRLSELAQDRYGPGRGWKSAFHRAVVDAGIDVKQQAVSAWLIGKSLPSLHRVRTLDDMLGAQGELVALYGTAADEWDERFRLIDGRLDALADDVADLRDAVAQLVRRRRASS